MNRVKFSSSVTFEQVEKVMPAGYEIVPPGADAFPGRIGEGFGGEPLVILLADDAGTWFDDLVASVIHTKDQ